VIRPRHVEKRPDGVIWSLFSYAVKKPLAARAFHFYLESVEMLYAFVFAAKRMVKVMPL